MFFSHLLFYALINARKQRAAVLVEPAHDAQHALDVTQADKTALVLIAIESRTVAMSGKRAVNLL